MSATRKSKKKLPTLEGLKKKLPSLKELEEFENLLKTAKAKKRLPPRKALEKFRDLLKTAQVKPPRSKVYKMDHPNHQLISDILAEGEENTQTCDGLGEALVGLSLSQPGRPVLAVYDYEKCVQILVRRDKMTDEEAREFLDFNTVGAWVGEDTPIFINNIKNLRAWR